MPLKLKKRPGRLDWYMSGTIRGIHIRETTGTADREAAEAIRIKRENELLQRSIHGAAATATFGEAALSYLQLGGDDAYLQPILDRIEHVLLAKIDQDFIDKLALAMYPANKPSSRNRQVYTPISAVLHHAAKRKLCPAPSISRPKTDQVEKRALTNIEADRLIEACLPHLRPLVVFLLATGARLSEALYIDWRQIDLVRGHADFLKTKNGEARGAWL